MIRPAHDEQAIQQAVNSLTAGDVVALPTETVYGLAGDALNDGAVQEIYRIKGRPASNPLIAHVSGLDMAGDYVEIDTISQRLMEAFWPGPLTLVLPRKSGMPLSSLACSALPTLAVRQPQGIFCQILAEVGRPLVAPSANRSGRISPTSAQDVAQELGGQIPLILDGGACAIGLESTIIKVVGKDVVMLRAGGLARSCLEDFLCQPLHEPPTNGKREAPGMLSSHYAPRAKVRLNVREVEEGENLLAFGSHRAAHHQRARRMLNLSERGDSVEAARHLFDYLRQLDEECRQGEIIAVEPIPEEGLGEAINDRLRRASAPRPVSF